MAINSTLLGNPEFVQSMIDHLKSADATFLTVKDLLPRPPKFRKAREVHSQRARKLRRRGEYVHFVRWQGGRCVYSWSGKVPETFTFRMHPASQSITRNELPDDYYEPRIAKTPLPESASGKGGDQTNG